MARLPLAGGTRTAVPRAACRQRCRPLKPCRQQVTRWRTGLQQVAPVSRSYCGGHDARPPMRLPGRSDRQAEPVNHSACAASRPIGLQAAGGQPSGRGPGRCATGRALVRSAGSHPRQACGQRAARSSTPRAAAAVRLAWCADGQVRQSRATSAGGSLRRQQCRPARPQQLDSTRHRCAHRDTLIIHHLLTQSLHNSLSYSPFSSALSRHPHAAGQLRLADIQRGDPLDDLLTLNCLLQHPAPPRHWG